MVQKFENREDFELFLKTVVDEQFSQFGYFDIGRLDAETQRLIVAKNGGSPFFGDSAYGISFILNRVLSVHGMKAFVMTYMLGFVGINEEVYLENWTGTLGDSYYGYLELEHKSPLAAAMSSLAPINKKRSQQLRIPKADGSTQARLRVLAASRAVAKTFSNMIEDYPDLFDATAKSMADGDQAIFPVGEASNWINVDPLISNIARVFLEDNDLFCEHLAHGSGASAAIVCQDSYSNTDSDLYGNQNNYVYAFKFSDRFRSIVLDGSRNYSSFKVPVLDINYFSRMTAFVAMLICRIDMYKIRRSDKSMHPKILRVGFIPTQKAKIAEGYPAERGQIADIPNQHFVRIGAVLRHIFRGALSDRMIEYYVTAFATEYGEEDMDDVNLFVGATEKDFLFATTSIQPKGRYSRTSGMAKNQASSCMRYPAEMIPECEGVHPSSCYATGDFLVAWIKRGDQYNNDMPEYNSFYRNSDGAVTAKQNPDIKDSDRVLARCYIAVRQVDDKVREDYRNVTDKDLDPKIETIYTLLPIYSSSDSAVIHFKRALLKAFNTETTKLMTSSNEYPFAGDLVSWQCGLNNLTMRKRIVSRVRAIVFPYVDQNIYSGQHPEDPDLVLLNTNSEVFAEPVKLSPEDIFAHLVKPAREQSWVIALRHNNRSVAEMVRSKMPSDEYLTSIIRDRNLTPHVQPRHGSARHSGGKFSGSVSSILGRDYEGEIIDRISMSDDMRLLTSHSSNALHTLYQEVDGQLEGLTPAHAGLQ